MWFFPEIVKNKCFSLRSNQFSNRPEILTKHNTETHRHLPGVVLHLREILIFKNVFKQCLSFR